jgi:uncharacterized protein (DUF486 family)
VFVPFALLYMRQPMNWNFLWAGHLRAVRFGAQGCCLLGAVYFMFR